MTNQDLFFELSGNEEKVVRTYTCTEFRPWLSRPTIGYLTITNKRLVFHSTGKSLTGQSFLINEMPLEDVAGINIYQGVSINWISVIIFALLGYFISTSLLAILNSTFWIYAIAFFLIAPHSMLWLFSSNLIDKSIKDQVFSSIDNIFNNSIKIKDSISLIMRYTSFPFNFGLLLVCWGINTVIEQNQVPIFGSFVMLIAYILICFNLFGREYTFSLLIGSKTMKGSGISIVGNMFQALSIRDNTALQTLSAKPSTDAMIITREIGALIMDIKQMGNFGIQKWQK